MSDLPSVEVSILIDAPPEEVWGLVADVTRVGDWGAECKGAAWIEGATGAVDGARFRGRQRREDQEWETISTVTEAKQGASFAWAVGDPSVPSASWRYDLSPEGDATRVAYSAVMGPGPSGLTAVIAQIPDREEDIIAGRLEEHRRNMTATLEAIKRAAEAAD